MKKYYTHNLTLDEVKELEFIYRALNSNDEESVKLALGLLKNYPQSMKTKHTYSTLRILLYQIDCCKNDTDKNHFTFFKFRLLALISAILINKLYYVEKTIS